MKQSSKLFKFVGLLLVLGLLLAVLPTGQVKAQTPPDDPQTAIQLAADVIVNSQAARGDWGDGITPAPDSLGVIGTGLIKAYARTKDPLHLASIQKAAAHLLTKTNNFSPADGMFAAELDALLGGSTYRDFVKADFFDQLATGTYGVKGDQDAGEYIATLNSYMNSQDPALGLISAHLCGAEKTLWANAVKDYLNSVYLYEGNTPILDAAKGIYSLAFVGETFDPTTGSFAAATDLAGMAAQLAAYPSTDGSFPKDTAFNESNIQATAAVILTLDQVNSSLHKARIQNAANWLLSVQNAAGYWEFYGSEDYASTAVSAQAVNEAFPAVLSEMLCTANCYVAPTGADTNMGNETSPFATIQKGVNAVADDGTVHVGAGNYAEQVTVNKPLTILGPNAAIAGNGTRVDEAILTFPDGLTGEGESLLTVASDDVTISGLKFEDKPYLQALFPEHIYTLSANNLKIQNNIFIGSDIPIYRDPYVNPVNPDNTGWLIENNKMVGGPFVNSQLARGMYIYKTGATIRDNAIEGYGVGIQILPADAIVGGVVENNTIGAGYIGLYHNDHDKGAGEWSYSGNTITVAPNNRLAQNLNSPILPDAALNFRAIQITNFGNGGTGALPKVTFSNNTANLLPEAGSLVVDRIAIRLNGNAPAGTTVSFDKNYFVNYTVGVKNETISDVAASPNWWGSAAGPAAGAIVGPASYVPFCGEAACTTLITPPVHNVIQDTYFFSIQAAIDAATAGDTIEVSAGTYIETVTVNKDVTLDGLTDPFGSIPAVVQGLISITADGATVSDLKIGPVAVTGDKAGISISASHTTVSGNLIDGITGNGVGTVKGIHVYNGSAPALTSIAITGNTINNIVNTPKGADGIQILGMVDGVAVTDNTIQTITGGWAYGIEVTPTLSALDTPPHNVVITGNMVDGVSGVGLSIDTAGTPAVAANASEVEVHRNTFINVPYALVNKDAAHQLSADQNWFGSAFGPQVPIGGDIKVIQWCAVADCSSFAPKGGVIELSGNVNVKDGINIYVPHLTYLLKNGTVIQNSSPCFNVHASYVTITTESIGGAKCVPNAGANGIDVDSGLVNIIIKGIEYDGSGQTTGSGIAFLPGLTTNEVTDVQVVDNWFHNLNGSGISFAGAVTGSHDIQGNLFQNLGAAPVVSPTTALNAEFNSWGVYAGTSLTNVDSNPWTHVDLSVASSDTQFVVKEVLEQEFTITVSGNLQNVVGVAFALNYDTSKLDLLSATPTALFDHVPEKTSVLDYGTDGVIKYDGYKYPGFTGEKQVFYTATFKTTAIGDAAFSFNMLTDTYAMAPLSGPSSNIYPTTLTGTTVTVLQLPAVTSTFDDSYYLVGEARDFTITVTNAGTAYAQPELRIVIPTGLTLKYNNVDYTNSLLVVDLADLTASEVVTTTLTATFSAPFNVTAAVLDVDLYDALGTPELLVDDSFSAFAYTKPTVTIAGAPYYILGEPGAFTVTINNPTTGRNYDNTAVFDIVIANPVSTDISALTCSMAGHTWDLKPALVPDVSGVKARIAGDDGYFTVPPLGTDTVVTCSVTYNTVGTYTTSGNMVDVIATTSLVERVVNSNISATAAVYAKPVISTTFSIGPYATGVPVVVPITTTNPDGIPGPFELVLDLPNGTVFTFGGGSSLCGDNPATTGVTEVGCPPIPVTTLPFAPTAALTITFNAGYTGNVGMRLYDTTWVPYRLLATSGPTAVVVNGGFVVTGTFSMQSRVSRAGIPVTLTWAGLPAYKPSADTINQISNNFSLTLTYGGNYTLTTVQPRYLNVTTDLGKTITGLAANHLIPALQLRGGNARWHDDGTMLDNEINIGDATLVGTQYNSTGTTDQLGNNGDCNFDGIVNIQDLAMVGGNFDLTSAEAYKTTTWMP